MKSRHIHFPLYLALGLIICLGILHFLNIMFYLDWTYWWYDMLLHTIAGTVGGLASSWVLFRSGAFFRPQSKAWFVVLATVFCVLIAALDWEIFEYLNGLTDSFEGYRLDTITDVLCGCMGALVASVIFLKHRKHHG
jgi:uncharacterized membrane protein YjdF